MPSFPMHHIFLPRVRTPWPHSSRMHPQRRPRLQPIRILRGPLSWPRSSDVSPPHGTICCSTIDLSTTGYVSDPLSHEHTCCSPSSASEVLPGHQVQQSRLHPNCASRAALLWRRLRSTVTRLIAPSAAREQNRSSLRVSEWPALPSPMGHGLQR